MQNIFQPQARQTCVTGVVTVFESALLGAVNGVVSPLVGQPIFFTQVVGPAGGPVALNDLNGQFATVCGTFTVQNGRPVLNVTFAVPAGGGTVGGGTGAGNGLAGLLALLTRLLQARLFGGLGGGLGRGL